MATRVHLLAKELGVKSAAILEKCQAENLDVKNHMSTLSAGLEATIREWFSSGEHTTTVEQAAPVDLKKVVNKSRSRAKIPDEKKTAHLDVTKEATPLSPLATGEVVEKSAVIEKDDAENAVAEIHHSERQAQREKRKSPEELAHKKDVKPVVALEIKADPPLATPLEPLRESPVEAQEIESPPLAPTPLRMIEPAKPATPAKVDAQPYVPKPAQMQGPKVIRVEKADTVSTPARGGRRTALRKVSVDDVVVAQPSTTESRGRKGRKSGEKSVDEEASPHRLRARSQRRRGRSADVEVVGPHEWGDRDLQERQERLAQASASKLHGRERRLAQPDGSGGVTYSAPRRVEKALIKAPVTVKLLSETIGVRTAEIFTKLMQNGVMATINQTLDTDTVEALGLEFGVELSVEQPKLRVQELEEEFAKLEEGAEMKPRPPVVAFLGHVDHGKTSLLDRIRRARVASGESGGITQHIGSYLYDDGVRQVTFLDTPGHRAFTAMRARGANMTDIVVLVVAADDGVMPQTEEAISHAKAAGVSIVVALNKMDLPSADINRVLGQLSDKQLTPSEWGGNTEVVRTSAATGAGIDDLVEHLDYVAELNHLQARREGPATGWVVESEMTTGEGAVARLLVKSGTLKVGDVVLSGCCYGRVRKMVASAGRGLEEAGPSTPVEITGLDEVSVAGDRFFVVSDLARAKQIADEQRSRKRELELAQRRQITLENLFSEISAGEVKELNVIVKADVQGSMDVLRNSLMELNTQEVAVKVLHAAVGGVSESDVLLAEASGAIIVGFHVTADEHARSLAEEKGVEIRLYSVIYQITDDIKLALEGMLTPSMQEKSLGRVEVRRLFRISRLGVIAGCYVTEGVIPRSARIRLIRDQIVIREGSAMESLRRGKDDASEVRAGFECGIKLAGFDDIKEGDIMEAYEVVSVSRTLAAAGDSRRR